MNPSFSKLLRRPDYLIAFGFGSGLAPRAPGTAGSVVALLLFLPLLGFDPWVLLGLIVVTFVLGTWISDRVAAELEIKDPSGIVIDEFVGMWITLLWLPGIWWVVPAFLAFRLFDIWKPWPVSLADRELSGGLGIMVDDVVAGIYALATIQICHQVYLQLV